MNLPLCSIILVNFNGMKFMKQCLDSISRLNYPRDRIEILMIDNGSVDGSLEFVKEKYPSVITIINDRNNFTRALNIGIAKSKGEYVGFLNNDVELDQNWLRELVVTLQNNQDAGCVGSKILFDDKKTINSVGHAELPDHYFQDKGFKEIDKGQYNNVCEVDGICGGSVLYRRKCLEDIGAFDEDYIMYFEDVDMAYRCRDKSWKIIYTHKSILYHRFHGTSGGSNLTYLLCNRNRFFFLARHLPDELPKSIKSSHLYLNNQYEFLIACMPKIINKLVAYQSEETVKRILPLIFNELMSFLAPKEILQVISRYQIHYQKRKPTLCIYDHALHLIGGGQKYSATIAQILKDKYDIIFIANKEIDIQQLEKWYGLNLHNTKIKIVSLDYFDTQNRREIDPNIVDSLEHNPFDRVAQECVNYDIVLNANMVSKLNPLSSCSVFVCHFPDSERKKYFYAKDYSYLICNSNYGKYWIKQRWDIDADKVLYPSVDMYPENKNVNKENIILSVTRFEVGGSKKQFEMIQTFINLCHQCPDIKKYWKFILIGGSIEINPYLDRIKELINNNHDIPIEIYVNAELDFIKKQYSRAKIFWHACGYHESNPHLVEHFGMTTVEAMQNSCVPIVINGGGQQEIVEHGVSGFLFDELDELIDYTCLIILDKEKMINYSHAAFARSAMFSAKVFKESVLGMFNELESEYLNSGFTSVDDLKLFIEHSKIYT